MRPSHQSGFSTLEVIAAVAIIAVALVPIMDLQTELARSQARLAETSADSTAVNNALALMRDVNPMQAPEGRRRLDDRTAIVWTSVPISSVRQSVNPPGFEVQLYRLNAVIERGGGGVLNVQVDVVGWRRATEAP